MTKGHCKILVFYTFSGLVAIGSLVFFFVGMSCAFLYLFDSYPVSNFSSSSVDKCDVFEGSWIRDESYRLYNASQCPFAEIGFNCFANGRKDGGYAKWRWKPKNCDIPRFDVRTVRVVFVGDSLSRTQWESLICLLMTGVEDKNSVYEVNVNKITKQIRFLSVRFSSFHLRIDFYRSVFLVQSATVPIRLRKRVKSTLRVDQLDDTSKEWIDSDILIFNSGHWWTPSKLFDIGRNRNSCKVTQHPWSSAWGKDQSTISDIIIKIVRKMKVPVTILHVTPTVSFRSDGHVGTWSNNPSVPDCSHWCLPGVPDMWNEILLNLLPHESGFP